MSPAVSYLRTPPVQSLESNTDRLRHLYLRRWIVCSKDAEDMLSRFQETPLVYYIGTSENQEAGFRAIRSGQNHSRQTHPCYRSSLCSAVFLSQNSILFHRR